MSGSLAPHRRVALAGLVVLLLGLWGAGGITATADGLSVRASTDGPIPVMRDDGRVWNVVRFEPGGEVELRLPIAQRGPLPVTVRDARVTRRPRAERCGWAVEEVRLGRPGDHAPVTLRPDRDTARLERGDTAELRLTGRFTGEPGCLPSGTPVSRGAAYLDITVAGLGRQQRMPLPEVLTWSTDPASSADRFARAPTAPRVGSPA